MAPPFIPLSVRPKVGGRRSSRGSNPSDSFEYTITGVSMQWQARALLDGSTPLSYTDSGVGEMWKQRIDVQERQGAFLIWDGVAEYGPVKLPDAGDWTWGFDSTVETQHVTHGLEHIADYGPSSSTPKNHQGAIGVTQDGSIEGAEKQFPKFEWWEKHLLLYTNAADAWALSTTLASCGGCTNAYAFRGFEPYRVLFLGGTGERSNTRPGLFELNVRFRAEVNRFSIPIGYGSGAFTVSSKLAWEYLWIESGLDATNPSAGAQHVPTAAHVERMYDAVDFAYLGLNTGPPTY